MVLVTRWRRKGIKHLFDGSYTYPTLWPDIAYAVGIVSQFMHDLRATHLEAVYHILRYPKSALGKRDFVFQSWTLEVGDIY